MHALNEQKQRILIVDDVPTNIHALIEVLQERYVLMVANSGPKALELAFSDTPPDLILLDVMMPDMDGYEVIGELKADSRTVDIPVMFVSAKGEIRDEAKGFALGAADYIIKPISPLIVQARIRVHLELKQQKAELKRTIKILEGKLARTAPPKRNVTVAQTTVQPAAAKEPAKIEEYFLDDHRGDLAEIEEELDAVVNTMLLQKRFDVGLIRKSGQLFERYAGLLSLYPVFSNLGGGMREFALKLQKDEFSPGEESTRLAFGCLESLIYTLEHWSKQVFGNMLENPNVFDNSMLSDMETIVLTLDNQMDDTSGLIEFF